MKIDSITNGIVIDHILAGKGMELYHFLHLDSMDCSIALIKNAPSQKMGKKDIIKVDTALELDLIEKFHPQLPEKLTNIIQCKNPRCITSVEQEIPHIFKLTDREHGTYRCIYCESKAKE